jgi:hypothetical protein
LLLLLLLMAASTKHLLEELELRGYSGCHEQQASE